MVERGTDTIRFGTDGWRASMGQHFTLSRLRRVVWAACQLMAAQAAERPDGLPDPEVVIGYDRRFLAQTAASEAAAVTLTAGWRVRLAACAAPTPAACWEVVQHQAAGAFVMTASHNPPHDLGIKVKGPHGGPVDSEWARQAESVLAGLDPDAVPAPAVGPTLAQARRDGRLTCFHPDGDYLTGLRRYAFADDENAAGMTVAADAMFGSAGAFWHPLFAPLGIRSVLVRTTDNPRLPGIPRPEPLPQFMRPLQRAVRRTGAQLGVITDGDGDRISAVADDGTVVDTQRSFALLLWYLAEVRGWRGTVVKTYAGSRWIDDLAAQYRLPFYETPIGFKHVVPFACEDDFLIGGEEAGGIGVRGHLPERDGLLCALLLIDLVRRSGQPLSWHLAQLEERLGPSAYGRRDLRLGGAVGPTLIAYLEEQPWDRLAGETCLELGTLDGVKFELENGGWLLVRPSGTEPVVRIYTEGPDSAHVERRLAAAARRVEEAVADL